MTWSSNDGTTLDYDDWCMQLAKKFNSMFKAYRKFSVRYLGVDPSEKEGGGAIEETKDPQLGQGSSNSQTSKTLEKEEVKEEEEDLPMQKPAAPTKLPG